jgi:hypothetical protein
MLFHFYYNNMLHFLIKILFFCSLLSINAYAQTHSDYPMMSITVGKVGAFTPDRRSDRYGLEYRAKPFSKWKLIPTFGIAWSTKESKFIYSELKHDWNFKKNMVFTTSLGVGIFDNNNNLDLGHPIEFRTGFELSYRFKNGYRVGVAAFHLSNSRLSQKNPGTEAIVASFLIPIHRRN